MAANNIPGVWKDSRMNLIYTLTPTHCGTGQTGSGVDLPIARDVVTGVPILPATAIKGVVREKFENHENFKDKEFKNLVYSLFGPDIDKQEQISQETEDIFASALAFTEARLVAFPVRSLNRPFFWVTCPLIMETLARDAKLIGNMEIEIPELDGSLGNVYVSDESLNKTTIVIEDLCFSQGEVVYDGKASVFAEMLSDYLLPIEQKAAKRLKNNLVIIPDNEFCDLIKRGIPVIARTKLTGGKTADEWKNPETGEKEKGNLWYEEFLPSDSLFISFTGQRRHVYTNNNHKKNTIIESPLSELNKYWKEDEVIQIGGNETIGYGLCLWNMIDSKGGK